MKRLLMRGLILAAPFMVLGAFVVVIDPYMYFDVSHLVPAQVKAGTAGKLHYALYKVQEFRRAPKRNLLLGDSRMAGFSTDQIRSLTGNDYFNFAYGGGTPTEAIDTYWLAARMTKLDAVYIEMGIINFNAYQNLNRVPEVRTIVANPLNYLTNPLVIRSAFLAAYVVLTGDSIDFESPSMNRDKFWRFAIDEDIPQLLHRYAYPDTVARRLQELAEDCRRNGTRLVFVIPPMQVDAQAKVRALGRDADDARFRSFVATLGPVFDFDFANDFTADRRHFSDPFHVWNNEELIREIWGNERRYVRTTP